MAFNLKLSPEAEERLAFTRREIERLYNLPDRWLGEELLRLARRARQEQPELLKDPLGLTYDPTFVWHLVPNIAARLGVRNFDRAENHDSFIRNKEGQAFRELVGSYLSNLSLGRHHEPKARRPSACELLSREVANGNPVAIALDRLVPAPAPGEDKNDYVARHVREISRVRGIEETPTWSPGMNHYGRRAERESSSVTASSDGPGP